MGQQDGLLRLKGSVGEFTFFKRRDGSYMARKKSGVDGKRMLTDPAFARTRENWDEFKKASVGRRVLREALRTLTTAISASGVSGRLQKEFMKVVKADKTSLRGARNVMDGETELLVGFEFNESSTLKSTLFAPFSTAIDRVTGTLTVTIPQFDMAGMIIPPQGATHYRLISGGAEIDFEKQTYVVKTDKSADLSLASLTQDAITLSHVVTAESTKPLFLVFGIVFLQDVNGVMSFIQNGENNALKIVAVDGGVRP